MKKSVFCFTYRPYGLFEHHQAKNFQDTRGKSCLILMLNLAENRKSYVYFQLNINKKKSLFNILTINMIIFQIEVICRTFDERQWSTERGFLSRKSTCFLSFH